MFPPVARLSYARLRGLRMAALFGISLLMHAGGAWLALGTPVSLRLGAASQVVEAELIARPARAPAQAEPLPARRAVVVPAQHAAGLRATLIARTPRVASGPPRQRRVDSADAAAAAQHATAPGARSSVGDALPEPSSSPGAAPAPRADAAASAADAAAAPVTASGGTTAAAAPAPASLDASAAAATGTGAAPGEASPGSSTTATGAEPAPSPGGGAAANQIATAAPAPAATAAEPGSDSPDIRPALAVPPEAHVVLPRHARLVYGSVAVGHWKGIPLTIRGRTTTDWRYEDGRYETSLGIDVVDFGQTSSGQFRSDYGLAPDRYTERRRRRGTIATDFDWSRHRVTFSEASPARDAEPGAQDRLSLQFQLSVLRQVYPERFVPGAVLPIPLAGTRDITQWYFVVGREEEIETGQGTMRGLRMQSRRTDGDAQESLEVWISPDLDWLPIRIRIVDRDNTLIDSVLDQATVE